MDRVQIGALVCAVVLFGLSIQLGSPTPGGSAPGVSEPTAGEPVEEPARSSERGSSSASPSQPSIESAEAGDAQTGETPAPEREFERARHTLENPNLRLTVNNTGRFELVELLDFAAEVGGRGGPVELVTLAGEGLLQTSFGRESWFSALKNRPFEVTSSTERSVTHRLERGGVEVVRKLSIDDTGYGAELRLRVVNRGQSPVRPRFEVSLYARERDSGAPDHFQNAQLTAWVEGGRESVLLSGLEVPGMFGGGGQTRSDFSSGVDWVAVETQYFLAAVLADSPRDHGASVQSLGPQQGRVTVRYPAEDAAARATPEIPVGQQIEKVYRLYFGPKLEEYALAVDARLEPSLRVGWSWVRPLVVLFAVALQWLYDNVVANYGMAIILLTILLRLATFPLTQRSMKSMKRLSTVAPQMKELQEKFKDDSARMQQEMMALYKRTGVNPFSAMAGGCLPMMLQMPFMIALYFALQGSIELRHADFLLWIDDLSAPEDFVSVAGLPIRPLPLLMGASMVLQQWLTPSTGDEQQKQQRQMMMAMSGVFTIMFYQFPAGLVLYWLVSNLLGIGQQLLVNREPTT